MLDSRSQLIVAMLLLQTRIRNANLGITIDAQALEKAKKKNITLWSLRKLSANAVVEKKKEKDKVTGFA